MKSDFARLHCCWSKEVHFSVLVQSWRVLFFSFDFNLKIWSSFTNLEYVWYYFRSEKDTSQYFVDLKCGYFSFTFGLFGKFYKYQAAISTSLREIISTCLQSNMLLSCIQCATFMNVTIPRYFLVFNYNNISAFSRYPENVCVYKALFLNLYYKMSFWLPS